MRVVNIMVCTGCAIIFALIGLATNQPVFAGDPPQIAAPFTKMSWRNLRNDKVESGVIRESEGFTVNWSWEGKKKSAVLLCSYCGVNGMEYDKQAYEALWPLAVGNSATIKRNKGSKQWVNEVEVAAQETLELEFGAVETFRIEMTSKRIGGKWRGKTTAWFAPGIGWQVKFIESDNDHLDRSWEAISFE